jgi:hypothetical protein
VRGAEEGVRTLAWRAGSTARSRSSPAARPASAPATCRRFVAEGARVVVADLNDDAGESFVRELGAAAAFRHTDVGSLADVEAAVALAVERFGGSTSCTTTPRGRAAATRTRSSRRSGTEASRSCSPASSTG